MDNLEYSPSALHFELFDAAYSGKLNRFKRLALDHAKAEGIGVGEAIRKLVDECGRGSLHIAAVGGSLNVCKYLLETLKIDVDSKDRSGHTPLYHAIVKGHLDTVRYLVEKGANPDASNDKTFTPLHYAAKSGDTKIITLLLSRGVHVDAAISTGTALQHAAGHGHPDAVKLLLDHGANPNGVNCQCMLRPLIVTILCESWECMELLLQAGADPNAVSSGNTPLAVAARDKSVDVVTRLLEAGADPNYKMN
ncbi:hypothetical protein MKW94_018521, partial [Papaver nudicaule]|nr:hypothetical protein [Papaver nudicaule]